MFHKGRMTHIIILLLAAGSAQAAWFSSSWESILNSAQGKVFFGVSLKGTERFERNGNSPMAPASVSKMFTSGLALERLGPNYRYKTILKWRESAPGEATDLTLVGSGDPSWGMAELGEKANTRAQRMALHLSKAGIQKVVGEIRAESVVPELDDIEIPQGWMSHDITSCGGAIAQGFNIALNCAVLEVSAEGHRWNQVGVSTPVRTFVKKGASNSLKIEAGQWNGRWGYVVRGNVKTSQKFYIPVWDAKNWARNQLVAEIKKAGIQVDTQAEVTSQGDWKEFVIESPPLSVILKPFMKNSINLMGDAILKTVAIESPTRDRSPLVGGLLYMSDYLSSMGLSNFKLNDGCGMSRTSRISANTTLAFLEKVKQGRDFPAFWNALAVAGVDGTLRHRMKGTSAEGKLRGKTGTLNGVYNLAGFMPNSKSLAPFVVYTKTTVANRGIARGTADKLGVRLAQDVGDTVTFFSRYSKTIPYYPEHAGYDGEE